MFGRSGLLIMQAQCVVDFQIVTLPNKQHVLCNRPNMERLIVSMNHQLAEHRRLTNVDVYDCNINEEVKTAGPNRIIVWSRVEGADACWINIETDVLALYVETFRQTNPNPSSLPFQRNHLPPGISGSC